MGGMRPTRRLPGTLALRDSFWVRDVVLALAVQVSDPGYNPRERVFQVTLGQGPLSEPQPPHL